MGYGHPNDLILTITSLKSPSPNTLISGGTGELGPQHEFGGDTIQPIKLGGWGNGIDKKGQGQSQGRGCGKERRGQRVRGRTQLGD